MVGRITRSSTRNHSAKVSESSSLESLQEKNLVPATSIRDDHVNAHQPQNMEVTQITHESTVEQFSHLAPGSAPLSPRKNCHPQRLTSSGWKGFAVATSF